MTAQGVADQRQRVIGNDQRQRGHHGGALAAPARGDAQRDAHQHEYQAGCRIGKTLVDLQQESLAVRTVAPHSQFIHRHGVDEGVQASEVPFVLLAWREGAIGHLERRDVGKLRLAGPCFILGSVTQAHEQVLG